MSCYSSRSSTNAYHYLFSFPPKTKNSAACCEKDQAPAWECRLSLVNKYGWIYKVSLLQSFRFVMTRVNQIEIERLNFISIIILILVFICTAARFYTFSFCILTQIAEFSPSPCQLIRSSVHFWMFRSNNIQYARIILNKAQVWLWNLPAVSNLNIGFIINSFLVRLFRTFFSYPFSFYLIFIFDISESMWSQWTWPFMDNAHFSIMSHHLCHWRELYAFIRVNIFKRMWLWSTLNNKISIRSRQREMMDVTIYAFAWNVLG